MQVYIPSVQTIIIDSVIYQGVYLRELEFSSPYADENGHVFRLFLVKILSEDSYFKAGVYEFKSAIGQLRKCYEHCLLNDFHPLDEILEVEKIRTHYEYEPFDHVSDLSGFDENDVSVHSLCLLLDIYKKNTMPFNLFDWVFGLELRNNKHNREIVLLAEAQRKAIYELPSAL